MQTKNKKLDFSGQDIYTAIDVHKKSWQVSIGSQSLMHKTFNQPPQTDILIRYLRKNFPGGNYKCVYEAGFSGFWLYDQLQQQGIDCIVVNPADVPTNDKERRRKTDKVDSRKIMNGLREGTLDGIYVPCRSALEDRSLLRMRNKLVKDQTRCKNRIKSLLYFYGITIPEQFTTSPGVWSNRFLQWLTSVKLMQASGDTTLNLSIQQAVFIRQLTLEITKQIRALSKSSSYNESVKLLMSIPGIGMLTAMVILTELTDIDRFKGLDRLCGYIGLVPDIKASGEKEYIGQMTSRGNRYLKGVIILSCIQK